MLRRLVPVTLALGLCLTAIAAPPASAWSNGSHGPNSFGTHDWVLREGVRLSGRAGNWVCLKIAMARRDGMDIKVLSDRLGHASVVTTINLYQHVPADMAQEAAESVARFILG